MLKTNETGRSMVEMLGVLAVMGVLSVSGVAMYTSAMNKHRANELLNAVSVRATALASQRMTGKALSLAGFTDNTQGTSVIDVNSSNAGAIEITISNVPLSVCKNMYNTRGDNVIEMKSGTTVLNGAGACEEGATVSIKFNNDLSKSGSSSDSGGGEPQNNSNCPSGTTVEEGYTGADALGNGKCICTSYTTNQCGGGFYCQFNPTSCTESPSSGICKPISYLGNGGTTTVGGYSYTVNDCNGGTYPADPDWWSAQSWCKAQGKTLVSLSDLGCTANGPCSGGQNIANALSISSAWTTDVDEEDSCYVWGANIEWGYAYSQKPNLSGCALCKGSAN